LSTRDELTHLSPDGSAKMVDVSRKTPTDRMARAECLVKMQEQTALAISEAKLVKGDVISVARVAGIMAAKRTSDLVPLCHPLSLDHVELEFTVTQRSILIESMVRSHGRTGVEMEALTAVSVAALTIYDMAKAMDRSMEISHIRLLEKRGGRSGTWQRDEP
jgi:cyclic pyranopterin phosphate synthase